MAFYSEFKNLSTGLTLTQMSDFGTLATGIQIQKNTGEVYTKQADGTFNKTQQAFYNTTDSDARYVNVSGDTITGSLTINTNLTTKGTGAVEGDIYVGKDGGSDSNIHFYDDNSNTWRTLAWDDSANCFVCEDDTGVARTIVHSGNLGSFTFPSATNANTLDSLDSSQFLRSDTNDSCTGNLSLSHVYNLGNNAYDIGTSASRWRTIYAGTFDGTATYASNSNALDGLDSTQFLRSDADDTATGNLTLRHVYNPTNNTYDIGTAATRWRTMYAYTFNGTATSANYADLAEKYESDETYPIGTVVEVGGDKEITLYNGGALAGVISGKPGLMLNSEAIGQYVALKGKVPVFCEGDVKKGQYCLAANGGKVTGHDYVDANYTLKVVGVALEDSKDGMVMVKI